MAARTGIEPAHASIPGGGSAKQDLRYHPASVVISTLRAPNRELKAFAFGRISGLALVVVVSQPGLTVFQDFKSSTATLSASAMAARVFSEPVRFPVSICDR